MRLARTAEKKSLVSRGQLEMFWSPDVPVNSPQLSIIPAITHRKVQQLVENGLWRQRFLAAGSRSVWQDPAYKATNLLL